MILIRSIVGSLVVDRALLQEHYRVRSRGGGRRRFLGAADLIQLCSDIVLASAMFHDHFLVALLFVPPF